MGKTYRYDPEDECIAAEAPSKVAKRKKGREIRLDAAGIDPGWAVERMSTRISCVVEQLIREGTLDEGERQEYIAVFNAQIVRFAAKYEPEWTDRDGRRHACSPLHYLRIVESGLVGNIRDYVAFRKRQRRPLAIVTTKEESESCSGTIHDGDRRLSDGCRSVRLLELRMDVETLESMLDVEERICLWMRFDGCTQEEIAAEISARMKITVDRDHVRKVVVLHLQEKARRCGFFPPSEMRGQKM